MAKPDKLAQLTAVLQKLGARDPAAWAESELREGIPQTARFLFLRQAWRDIVSESDPSWIERHIAHSSDLPNAPYAGAGHALVRLRERGATDAELTELVRAMQAQLLFSFCYLLEDPCDVDPEVKDIVWSLFLLDGAERPTRPLTGLHESVLETDPTGREVRPPKEWIK